MTKIKIPKPEEVPADSKPVLDAFTKMLGFTPNMLAIFAKSPIAFNAWAAFRASLNKTLDMKTREIISLAVSEVNGCNYCLAAHSYAADKAKLPADEIILARKGRAIDPKKDAAVQFAQKVMMSQGNVDSADIASVLEAGYSEANLIEIIVLAVTYSITNIFNNVLDPEIDYPNVVPAGSI